ncbi:proton-coupled amino acid transporter-like protein pathetic isoform X2 [Agrilus planipennis]|uniref:Proton-coupled amino acid transporter-like protein pathetic isoform X2 n=1 Tax=Agrilus planipennis TaxID=224129 RepID=A0A1W4WLI5_AGRPL|nr:proton-coupled amino acid transporter-like protein pathetic isoform X2 [Agrilus planipennis]
MDKEPGAVTELDTFIPKESNGAVKYEITKGLDAEAANALSGEFDPFKARVLEHPTSNTDTLIHLLKSCLGTGILAMPAAFASSGLVLGIFATILASLIVTHCSYILVVCAHELYKRAGKTQMSFADIAEEACVRGPKWARKFGPSGRKVVDIGIFITYYGTCSAYAVIVAESFLMIFEHYLDFKINIRLAIAILLVPCLLLCYVPNLKHLAAVSMLANVFMGLGIAITIYYLMIDIPPMSERQLVAPISRFPAFFSITVFALEGIGVVMPLENNMEKPQNFVGICGIMNRGMSFVTLIYIFLGFFGYLKYGELAKGSITLNLPKEEYLAQSVQILISLAVLMTFALQFFVCLDIVWNNLKHKFESKPLMSNYILRTVMVVVAIAVAVAVPDIKPFISLIGALCFSIIGLMVPVFIEIITFWDKGFGKYNWKIFKDAIVIITGLLALIFGTSSALQDIAALYTSK